MANKQQVYDAFYEGACTVLQQLIHTTGFNIHELDIDLDELREFIIRNDQFMDILGHMPF